MDVLYKGFIKYCCSIFCCSGILLDALMCGSYGCLVFYIFLSNFGYLAKELNVSSAWKKRSEC